MVRPGTITPCTVLRRTLLLFAAGGVIACGNGTGDQTAVDRGDVAFARDSLDEALAEYRLAVRQGLGDARVLARVAHAYARMGRVDEARDFYRDAVVEDGAYADQAVSDLVAMAREAARSGDHFLMASAMSAATEFRPGIGVGDLALPLARHYSTSGQYGRALPYYQKALATQDSAPELVFEIGRAYEEIGDCEFGLDYFERFRATLRPWERTEEVDWYIGSCALRLARERTARAEELMPRPAPGRSSTERLDFSGDRRPSRDPLPPSGREPRGAQVAGDSIPSERAAESRTVLLEEALTLVDRALEMGEPRNLMGQAWFERGEILAALGDCEEAVASFDRVRFSEPSESTALARRARERHDQLRFRRGLGDLRPGRPCG